MKIEICKTTFKYAPYYVEQAHKLGQKVYISENKFNGEEYYCVDILPSEKFWYNPKNEYKKFEGVTVFDFVEKKND